MSIMSVTSGYSSNQALSQAAFLRIDDGRRHCAVRDLEQIAVSILLGIPLLHPYCHPSLPKIPFVVHFEAFT